MRSKSFPIVEEKASAKPTKSRGHLFFGDDGLGDSISSRGSSAQMAAVLKAISEKSEEGTSSSMGPYFFLQAKKNAASSDVGFFKNIRFHTNLRAINSNILLLYLSTLVFSKSSFTAARLRVVPPSIPQHSHS